MAKKIVYITSTRIRICGPSRTTIWAGTIDSLVDRVFSYTLDCGYSWDHKVNTHPKTVKSLCANLDKASAASCRHYQDSYYREASQYEIDMFKQKFPNMSVDETNSLTL